MSERRAAVLGHPIGHSLSPVLHRAAYAALGLASWRYDAVDIAEEDLSRFVAGLDRSWAGLSLTMPLKRTILPLLDHVEPQALALGVVNTVLVVASGSARMLTGTNTDVHGLLAALREGGIGAHGDGSEVGSAVVLGAGATAASAIAALAQLGCPAPDGRGPIRGRRRTHQTSRTRARARSAVRGDRRRCRCGSARGRRRRRVDAPAGHR